MTGTNQRPSVADFRNRIAWLGWIVAAIALIALLAPSRGGSAPIALPQRDEAAARAALVKYLHTHDAPAMHAGQTHRSSAGTIPTSTSFNWSGFVDRSATTGAFTQVAGSWPVSKITCSPEQRLVFQWVGLDGWTDSTVEQDGSLGFCYEGTAYYYTWWEMYPATSVDVGSTVQPGDKIDASVVFSSGQYHLNVTDSTTPDNNIAVTESCAATCTNTSAEWITERPGTNIGLAPLAVYSTWYESRSTVTESGVSGTIASFDPEQIYMIDRTGSYYLSTATPVSTNGKAFDAKWNDSW